MHICQVVASWGNGGLEKHVIELSNALSAEHQVTVIVHPLMKDRFVEASMSLRGFFTVPLVATFILAAITNC